MRSNGRSYGKEESVSEWRIESGNAYIPFLVIIYTVIHVIFIVYKLSVDTPRLHMI